MVTVTSREGTSIFHKDGLPHGMLPTEAETINVDLLAFIQAGSGSRFGVSRHGGSRPAQIGQLSLLIHLPGLGREGPDRKIESSDSLVMAIEPGGRYARSN